MLSELVVEERAQQNERPRTYRTQPPPACPAHGVLMVVNATRERMRYFACPVPGCDCTDKQPIRDKEI